MNLGTNAALWVTGSGRKKNRRWVLASAA